MNCATVAGHGGKSIAAKLHGRAFYESIGSPKLVLAPMVDQSEFAWRLLTRSFSPAVASKALLAYTPMFHARLFKDTAKYRDTHFEPNRQSSTDAHLDGNPSLDRPLFVQFCANDPRELLGAAQHVAPYCDAIDLNLGCPQGIARKGYYGAFLQENQSLIFKLINTLHTDLDIPVTAKMRVLDTKEATLEYAKVLLRAGASILTVHGRRREQKSHITGLADWTVIRYLRDSLPPDTVIFANGNILQHEDIEECLLATGADGVMSAEGNLNDPTIFAESPTPDQSMPGYWRGRDGKGGYRMDFILRRYLDIIYQYVLGQTPPQRRPLGPGPCEPSQHPDHDDAVLPPSLDGKRSFDEAEEHEQNGQGPPSKKSRSGKASKRERATSPNLLAMQPHLFNLLRPLVAKHTHIRDALARARAGDMAAFESVLEMTEAVTEAAIMSYDSGNDEICQHAAKDQQRLASELDRLGDGQAADESRIVRCWRPWWICQPYVRPLPAEALQKGSITLSKKQQDAINKDSTSSAGTGVSLGANITRELAIGKNEERLEVPTNGLV